MNEKERKDLEERMTNGALCWAADNNTLTALLADSRALDALRAELAAEREKTRIGVKALNDTWEMFLSGGDLRLHVRKALREIAAIAAVKEST